MAVYRTAGQTAEFDAIRALFQEEKIEFIPLKGAILRNYYPSPWMRTSCDIDIFIHESDMQRASAALVDKLGYTRGENGTHDVSFYSESGVHLELHYTLCSDENTAKEALLHPFTLCRESSEFSHEKLQSPELFYLHFVSHTAGHFIAGGCGVRPFIDILMMDEALWESRAEVDGMLMQNGLFEFTKYMRALAAYWFMGASADETVLAFEKAVIIGGVYGNFSNRAAFKSGKEKNKFRFIMSRIFMPFSMMKNKYPILKKHKWLLPVCHIRRWCALLSPKRMKRASAELSAVGKVSDSEIAEARALMEKLNI